MKTLFLSLAAASFALGTTCQTMAAETDFENIDTNGDGVLSYDEVAAVIPEMTPDQFKAADTDGDGVLSKAEWTLTQ